MVSGRIVTLLKIAPILLKRPSALFVLSSAVNVLLLIAFGSIAHSAFACIASLILVALTISINLRLIRASAGMRTAGIILSGLPLFVLGCWFVAYVLIVAEMFSSG